MFSLHVIVTIHTYEETLVYLKIQINVFVIVVTVRDIYLSLILHCYNLDRKNC